MDVHSYQQLPLEINGSTKAISTTLSNDNALSAELQALNTLHRTLITSEAPNAVPPAPLPVNPKRSAQVTKMREAGNAAFRRGQHGEAIKLYSLGIEMAGGRPGWEPNGLAREELAALFANRAQAHMAGRAWPEAAVDAHCSVELKRVGNPKAWWRRGLCLLEMGRLDDAAAWVAEAIEFEGPDQELVQLLEDIKKKQEKEGL